jgi:D-alanyl-D-alanine carboxypeptidase
MLVTSVIPIGAAALVSAAIITALSCRAGRISSQKALFVFFARFFGIWYATTAICLLFKAETIGIALSDRQPYDYGRFAWNAVPFATITEYIGERNWVQITGNLIVFAPLPALLYANFPRVKRRGRALLSFLITALAEPVQLLMNIIVNMPYNVIDIDDFLLNGLGCLLGLLTLKPLMNHYFRNTKRGLAAVIVSSAVIVSAIVTPIIFFAPKWPVRALSWIEPKEAPAETLVTEPFERPNSAPREPFVIPAAAGEPAPAPTVNTRESAYETGWCLILVNRWRYIPDGYEVELTRLANGQSIDKRIYPALREMFGAAESEGVYPVVASGYRTAEEQERLMNEKIAEYRSAGCSDEQARTKAEAWVALPGTSEHQIGIAVDINADGIRSAGYEVYEWLERNAWRFGFIQRYPSDKTEFTGVIGEAWHYRYVGVHAAAEIQSQGVCLEEYLNETNERNLP